MASLDKLLRKSVPELKDIFLEGRRPVPRGLIEALEIDTRQGAHQLANRIRIKPGCWLCGAPCRVPPACRISCLAALAGFPIVLPLNEGSFAVTRCLPALPRLRLSPRRRATPICLKWIALIQATDLPHTKATQRLSTVAP